jgi:hypothetical protein
MKKRQETEFNLEDPSLSANARRIRWEQLMAAYKGKIDVQVGQQMLSDHYDSFVGKIEPDERTLCGHVDRSPKGRPAVGSSLCPERSSPSQGL